MAKATATTTITHPKTLLIAVQAPYNKTTNISSYFEEFLHLVSSNQLAYDHMIEVKLRSLDTGYFFTKGKLEEIHALCEKEKFEEIIISEPLTAMQERNLNALLHCKVFDRTRLILEIFEKSAHSAEGKLQVAIAMFQFQKSRVSGKGIHMSQQSGHIGGRGPGETAKEKELRHIENQVNKLKRQLKELGKTRDVQRKRRLDHNIPHICLIGYTNSGKSTLLNQLTHADVLAENRLFATLDTTTRELYIDGKKKGVISDTVGFIQQLPHQLIEAFKSTLSELQYADLLLHVVDIANPDWQHHIKVVNNILEELEVHKQVLYVFNKIDTPYEQHASKEEIDRYQPHVLISAQNKKGITSLTTFLHSWEKN